MKTDAIPFFALLGCSLTACGDKEIETETEIDTEPSAEDTDTTVSLGDISAIIGEWTIDSIEETYYGEVYNTLYPKETADSYEGYGISWSGVTTEALFFDILDTGDIELSYSVTNSAVLTIEGVEIYSNSYGYSAQSDFGWTVSESDGSYSMDTGNGDLACTLTGTALSCAMDGFAIEFSEGADIPEDFESLSDDYPATPEYTKEDCVDTAITATGDALEWGGFEGVGNDVALVCSEEVYSYDSYSYETVDALDQDDLVFAFEAPNDGCFAFNTVGSTFDIAIQLQDACDSEGVLDCSMTGRIEHGMESGEEVLVVIDGASDAAQAFNLSINEVLAADLSAVVALPADTSAINTSAWTGEDEISCTTASATKQFLWIATDTGTATFDLAGSDFDTAIQVNETACGGEAFCNDDNAAAESYQSILDVEVEQGAEYVITIGGYGGETGSLTMSITID